MSTQNKSITEVFQDESHEQCDHCQSIFSPAAYLVKLLETIDKYIKPEGTLRRRRPDLYELKLDCDNTLKEKRYLEIINEILFTSLFPGKKLDPWLKSFSIDSDLPFFLREHFPLVSIRTYLKENQISLEQIYRLFYPQKNITAESLGISEEKYALLINSSKDFHYLKKIYAVYLSPWDITLIVRLSKRKNFIQHTGIDSDELPELLRAYNKIKKLAKNAKLSIDNSSDEIKNLNDTALSFLHRLICLSHALGWSFDQLAYIFLALGSDEINEDTLKKIASISALEKSFSKELKAGYKEFVLEEAWHPSAPLLYLSERSFKEKVKKFVGGQESYDKLAEVDIHDIKGSDQMGVLQGILDLNNSELSALIDYQAIFYPAGTAVESLLQDFYAQSTLAHLMDIPIEELLGLMDLLDNEKAIVVLSSPENLQKVLTLHRALKTHNISAAALSKLLDANKIKARYAEAIKAVKEAIDQINPWDNSTFFNTIQPYFTLNKEFFIAMVGFTEKRTGKFFEKKQDREALLPELIFDIQLFSALRFIREDIDHITKYYDKIYKFSEGKWGLESIEKLLSYKGLKERFSGNILNLNQYIDWLYSKEYTQSSLLEKMAQLSSWDRQTLELLQKDKDLKDCFAKGNNPIEALKKIQSFMGMLSTSGLNANVLLKLKDLQGLKADAAWQKYVDTASELKLLGANSERREESEKSLQEQKRDLLCKYMLYENDTLENMRDLYAELLIDVEMSGCSNISPLKAALNSAQLYLHRCVMGLEKNTTLDPALSQELFELLFNYRKWEASQKIQTYPESYLSPTLRKIASPEYKKLQSTLMQGNITDEAVEEAYLQYFDDFHQVASLKIIDSYFEKVYDRVSGKEKPTIFFLGRTQAQPYEYYYSTTVMDTEHQKISYWTPWEKIQASIPSDTDTPTLLYAFNRLFVFWVQKTKKKQASGDVKNPSFKESVSLSIHYLFEKVNGEFSAVQTVGEIEITPEQADQLSWKKLAALVVNNKEGNKKYIFISIGEMAIDKSQHFIIDEDLMAQNKGSLSMDSVNSMIFYNWLYLKFKKDELKLLANRTRIDSQYRSRLTNPKLFANDNIITLLENYSENTPDCTVRNYPDATIIKSNTEAFLCLSNAKAFSGGLSPYLVYDGNSIELQSNVPTPVDTSFTFIRINMPEVASLLRQKAYTAGVKRLLTLELQEQMKPLDFSRLKPTNKVVPPDDSSVFQGPCGLYLWEIFFHVPTLVAWHLNQNQDFPTARKWQQYILDPIQKACDTWRFLPFKAQCDEKKIVTYLSNTQINRDLEIDPFDAYSIAAQKITSFEKYMVISYIENLLSWGDMLFEQGSWESINEATMLYIRAWDLLGAKPVKKGKHQIKPKSYDELKTSNQRRAEVAVLEKNLNSNQPKNLSTHVPLIGQALGLVAYGDYFCAPENEDFVGLWEKLQDRLYKIRHCLDIKGKPYVPALFEPAIDPKGLLQLSAGGDDGSDIKTPEISRVPFYRFNYMIGYAKSTVDTVIGFGAELLSVMEKKDAESLSALYNKQEAIIANLITPIKEKTIEALQEEHNALGESLNHANYRKGYYDDLISKGLSAGEQSAMDLSSSGIDSRVASTGIRGTAVAAHLIPTVYGMADGAFQPGSSIEAAAGVTDTLATVSSEKSQMTSTKASYERRAQEWTLQSNMAHYDTQQIQAQIEANLIYQANAQKELQVHQKSIEQMKEKKDFFEKKFTREELYSWMKGQIASIYFQGYKLALNISKQAEKTYQYELNSDEIFITGNGWNSLKEGLLAGHHLKLALEQMHAAYHDKNERRLEISKNISLKEITPEALVKLKKDGQCIFSFTEKLFDLDFPGHYNRKIKTLRMTIPAVVGPYENVHASLQQTANKTVLKAEGKGMDAVKFLLGEKGTRDPNDPSVLRGNVNVNQQIAISRGNEDNGMFELNFNDERYLPFEGTGAVSNWIFSLPKKNNRFDTESISDVIIHLNYIASDGGQKFRENIEKLDSLKNYKGISVLNPRATLTSTRLKVLFNKVSLKKSFSSGAQVVNVNDKTIFFQPNGNISIYHHDAPENKKWTTAQASQAREDASVAVVGNKAIFFGGYRDPKYLSAIDIYDAATGKWNTAQAPQGLWGAATAVVESKAIFFGGYAGNSGHFSTIYIYNAATGKWTKAQASEARDAVARAVVGKKAIFFGGIEDNGSSSAIDIYDSSANSWTKSTYKASEARAWASVAVVGSKAIFFSGYMDNHIYTTAVDIYDSSTNSWTKSTYKASEARAWASVAVVGSKAIFFGGHLGNYKYSSAIDIYDAATGKWTTAQASEARENASVAVIGNKAIFFGGCHRKDEYSSAVDIYDDQTEQWTRHTMEIPLKSVQAMVKDSNAIFIGLDKDNNAQMYVMETRYSL